MECPICYENKDTKKFYNCNHLLCNECYNKWINGGNICPECRAEPIISHKKLNFKKILNYNYISNSTNYNLNYRNYNLSNSTNYNLNYRNYY